MKTQLRRMLGWVLIALAPVLMYASILDIHSENALNNPSKVSYIDANVLATQRFRGHLEARYKFQVVKGERWFSATDSLGRKNLWKVISLHDWDSLSDGSVTIRVKYLVADPSVNTPADGSGDSIVDSIAGVMFPIIMFVFGFYTILKNNKRFVSLRRSAGLGKPAHSIVVSERDTQAQNDVQNEQNTRFPTTFVVSQIAGVVALLPIIAYTWGGSLRERAMVLLPYLANRSWVWLDLAVGIFLLGAGASTLYTSARKRRSHRTVEQ